MSSSEEFVGDAVCDALRCRSYSLPPSLEEFEAGIEQANVPAVFRCAVSDWAAVSKWDPFHGGLLYLETKVGAAAVVEAMLSESGNVFYGDLRSHKRVPIPFLAFITLCRTYLEELKLFDGIVAKQESSSEPACSQLTDSGTYDSLEQIYLAQVPIYNAENNERSSLEVLREDLETPIFLRKKLLSSINLWMNKAQSRSSTHYDPNHNLLCVVSGCKRVTLWPPSACPYLYPMPVYGEASNHSGISMEEPDLHTHPRAKSWEKYSEKIVLSAGDALFIPEGWFHQVDSDNLTIAVNFWWKSSMMSNMLEHMDGYYLRRIISRLVDAQMNKFLQRILLASNKETKEYSSRGKIEHADIIQQDEQVQRSDPFVQQKLYELISLVHSSVGVEQNQLDGSPLDVNSQIKCDHKLTTVDNCLHIVESDCIAKIFWSLEALDLRKILLELVHCFPRTLEALVLHLLGGAGAEVLTRKFDEMDTQTSREQQEEFYKLFYSVFDDPYIAMEKILNGKELFAYKALSCTLDEYLGIRICELKK